MRQSIILTAASLRAILCFIDPKTTPPIACYNDKLAGALADKIKEALNNCIGPCDGSQSVTITFYVNEGELHKEFTGVCGLMKDIFTKLSDPKPMFDVRDWAELHQCVEKALGLSCDRSQLNNLFHKLPLEIRKQAQEFGMQPEIKDKMYVYFKNHKAEVLV